ncbi:P-loop containing nucleoside triphosphate hydrolase protein [Crassisporium funariophilum]|nr:P-loop containing nucleoside triphosphate hydrolase protein [Crassisporium funariophilum]
MSDSSNLTTTFQDEILSIAVMGPTGTGKTSFINLLSGSKLQVGNELESCTADVQISEPFVINGRSVNLIDTPGFDDTKLSDTSVLNMIAAYLSYSHNTGRKLAGVIYMHRILDNRLGGISARNFRMFRNLCGEASLRSVVIATTMWDEVDERIGADREKELTTKDVFFKPALDKGAQISRHTNTLESAQEIIRSIIDIDSPSVVLQIQEELGRGLDITETQAGKAISRELFEQMARHREEMRGLMLEIQDATRARDEESRNELVVERQKMEASLTRIHMDSANLAQGYRDALARVEERLRAAEASAAAATSSFANAKAAGAGSKTPTGNEYPGQQTHSPIVQAVAATENSNAVLEGKLAAAVPVVGFWGKLSIMLAPFSLTWR